MYYIMSDCLISKVQVVSLAYWNSVWIYTIQEETSVLVILLHGTRLQVVANYQHKPFACFKTG